MKENSMNNPVITVILFFSFIILVRLGSNEVQPWDEGLYAVRAKSILHFDNTFVDQSEYSLGGMYSGTYPPLTVWAVSASMSIFGENEFSLRLFSVLCSIASLLLISLIAKRIVRDDLWLVAPALLFVTLAWNTYSRQGMTDIPLVTFFLLCFFSVIKGMETDRKSVIILWALVFMVGFSSALMTKIVKSLLPLMFLFMLFIQKGFKSQKLYFSLIAIAGLAMASLWYIFMIAKHGAVFSDALLVPHIFSVVEGNTKSLGAMYYINQLIISNPLYIITLATMLVLLVKRKLHLYEDSVQKYIFLTSGLWFVGVLLLFSLSVTKLYHYTVYLIPSLSLLSLMIQDKWKSIIESDRLRFFLLLSLIAALAWSLSPGLRLDLKQVLTGSFSGLTIGFMLLCTAILLVSLAPSVAFIRKLLPAVEWRLPLAILCILFFRIILINSTIDEGYSHGAKVTAQYLSKYHADGFVYLYHSFTPADSLNPQLAWYTGGAMCGWDKNKRYYPVGMPGNKFDLQSLRRIDNYPNIPLIYYLPDDKKLAKKIVSDIILTRIPVTMENNYVLFGVKRHERPKGITI